MNIIDKVVEVINPGAGLRRKVARNFLTSGYIGASASRNSMKEWNVTAGDSDSDDLDNIETLRLRSRDLYRNNPHGRGALRTPLTNVVGSGLSVQSRVDSDFLKLSKDQSEEWQNSAERIWKLWSESVNCDAARKLNFKGLQGLAFLSTLMSGDCFALLPQIKRDNLIDLSIQMLEADQCSTPFKFEGDAKVKDGVEVGKWGEPIAYHFLKTHPGSDDLSTAYDWARVPAYGKKTNRINVLHLFNVERPGQKRGVPFLSPVIESLKQFGRYTEAELMAAVVSGMFTVFLTTPEGDNMQLESAKGEKDVAPDISMGNGATVPLQPGEKIEFANPTRPNAQFGDFSISVLRQIGAALDIPFEVLVKQFNASFSASRAALLEAWKFFKTKRDWLSTYFCQPVYEAFIYEAVVKRLLSAPGYLSDPLIRKAYNKSRWTGPAKGMIDEVKAVKAAALRVQNNFSTRADESAEMNGSDFEENAIQLEKENEILTDRGLNVELTDEETQLEKEEFAKNLD